MFWPRFRPRFDLPLPVPPSAFIAVVRANVQRPGTPVTGIVLPGQVELRLPEREQRIFTPVLHLQVDEDGAGGAVLKARFAPHPHLWMLVIALYFFFAFVAVGGVMWAASQAILGGSLWSLLLVPAAAAAGGFTHGAILIGQGLSADQMHILRSFVEHALEESARPPP